MQAPAELAEQLPPPEVAILVDPARVSENWTALDGLFRSLVSWTQVIAPEEMRAPLTDGTLRLFAVRDRDGNVYVATAALFNGGGGVPICTTWLWVGPEAPESMATALLDEIEVFARLNGCSALSVTAFPAMAGRVAGKITLVIIERDLRIKHKELN